MAADGDKEQDRVVELTIDGAAMSGPDRGRRLAAVIAGDLAVEPCHFADVTARGHRFASDVVETLRLSV